MCSLHVIISHRDRDDEVDVKVIDHIGNQTKSDNQACVLKIGQLDIHRSKFNSPTNI